jgi:hypothetical protein
MVDLYNNVSGLAETIPDEELEKSYLGGTHFLKAGEIVNLKAPSGETIEVKPEEVANLLNSGFRFERKDEQTLREFRAEQQESPIISSLKTAAKEAINQVGFGIPEFIADKSRTDLEKRKREIEKEESPIAESVGWLGGNIVGLLAAEPVFKAAGWAGEGAAKLTTSIAKTLGPKAAESFAAKAASVAAKGVAEGAFIASPQAITEATLGDHESVGEGILAGLETAGIGALTGAGVELGISGIRSPISAALRVASEKFKGQGKEELASVLESSADRFHLKQVANAKTPEFRKFSEAGQRLTGRKLEPDEYNKLAKEFADEMGLGKFSSAEANIGKIIEKREASNQILNEVRAYVDGRIPFVVNTGDLKTALNAVKDNYNNEMGKVSGSLSDIGSMITYLDEKIAKQEAQYGTSNFSLEDLQIFNNEVKSLGYGANGKPASPGGRAAHDLLRQKLESTIEAAGNKLAKEGEVGAENILKDFKEAKSTLHKINLYEDAFQGASTRAQSNNQIGFGEYGGGILGSGLGGLPGAAVGAGLAYAKKNYGNAVMASTLYKTAELLRSVSDDAFRSIDQALGLVRSRASKVKLASVGILSRHNEDSRADKLDNFREFSNQIANFITDAQRSTDILANITGGFSTQAPMIQQAMINKISNGIAYLQKELPKPEYGQGPLDSKTYVPSDRQLSQFERKIQAVFDPLSVLKELKQGTITTEHVQALEAVYPKFLEAMRMRVIEQAQKVKGEIPAQARQALKTFLGVKQFNEKKGPAIQMLQDNFTSNYKPKPRANSKIGQSGRTETEIDRIQYQ